MLRPILLLSAVCLVLTYFIKPRAQATNIWTFKMQPVTIVSMFVRLLFNSRSALFRLSASRTTVEIIQMKHVKTNNLQEIFAVTTLHAATVCRSFIGLTCPWQWQRDVNRLVCLALRLNEQINNTHYIRWASRPPYQMLDSVGYACSWTSTWHCLRLSAGWLLIV